MIHHTHKLRAVTMLACFFIGAEFSSIAFASSQTHSHQVTIQVPSYLFIDSDQKDLSLSFDDSRSGSESSAQTVLYTVRGNGMMQAEGAPAVIAKLDGALPNMDLKVKMDSYTKEGGNTELGAVSQDFVKITDSDIPIAQKTNATGDGKLLRGQIAMTYKAVANSPLTSGEYSQRLTLTLTDI